MSHQDVLHGNNLDLLAAVRDNFAHAVVTDPPYGLGFMGKDWDSALPDPRTWAECLRVLRPGGHLVAFGAPRLVHRLTCQIEDAGFEVRDQLLWVFGCLSEDTEILVNGEWVHYRKAMAGSLAMCYDIDDDTFSEQPIEKLFVYDYDDTAYRIQSDGTDQIVSRTHKCIVQRGGRWVFDTAESVACEQQARVPVLEDVRGLLSELSVHEQNAAITPIHYTGKVWCVKVPTGAFVARRNGKIFVTGNSGFPKSLDVSKAIDAAAGAVRGGGVVSGRSGAGRMEGYGLAQGGEYYATAPATPEAARWSGWGTALKPAYESIVLARKPLDGTVAQTVQRWGTGAINVDGCRVEGAESTKRPNGPIGFHGGGAGGVGGSDAGRWPANLILDEAAGAMLDQQSGERPGAVSNGSRGGGLGGSSTFAIHDRPQKPGRGDSGGASRFFYCPKASRSEREAGLDHLPPRVVDPSREEDAAARDNPRTGAGRSGEARRNHHATVKPIDLMRWLVRLVTPPGGMVLEPFAGSGTTPAACALEDVDCLAMELDADYVEIARARVAHAVQQREEELAAKIESSRQMDLFAMEACS